MNIICVSDQGWCTRLGFTTPINLPPCTEYERSPCFHTSPKAYMRSLGLETEDLPNLPVVWTPKEAQQRAGAIEIPRTDLEESEEATGTSGLSQESEESIAMKLEVLQDTELLTPGLVPKACGGPTPDGHQPDLVKFCDQITGQDGIVLKKGAISVIDGAQDTFLVPQINRGRVVECRENLLQLLNVGAQNAPSRFWRDDLERAWACTWADNRAFCSVLSCRSSTSPSMMSPATGI